MSQPISLVTRATLWILAVVAFVGIIFLWWGNMLAVERETGRAQNQLRQLLDTVERPASIACFLQDQQLASEVSQGLLSNRIVERIIIRAGETLLAEAVRHTKPGNIDDLAMENSTDFIRRQLASPFNPDETVGEILLAADPIELKNQVIQASYFIGILLMVQIFAVGATVVLVVYRLITRPIKLISDNLHNLPVEQGKILAYPHRRHKHDELGGLVNYINRMITRLVSLLNEERNLRLQREIEERKFRSIFEHADTGIFLVDQHGRMLSYNPACREIMQAVGRVEIDPISRVASFFNNDEEQVRDMIKACLEENKNVQRDIKLVGKHGSPDRWIHMTLSRIEDVVFQGVANDITDRKMAETAAKKAAITDALTGILNRLGFELKLQDRLNKGYEKSEFFSALMMIDLDFFKQVNDTYGHDAGDRVLIYFARLLKGIVRKSDLIGRLGGDEFVLFLDYIDQPRILERIAQNIIASIAKPIDLNEEQTAQVGASIGIAIFRDISIKQEQLFKQVDEAMYQAKKNGRNTYCIYTCAQK